MFWKCVEEIIGMHKDRSNGETSEKRMITGKVVLMKKHFLDLDDLPQFLFADVNEVKGENVTMQLVSEVDGDPENKFLFWSPKVKGKAGKPARLEAVNRDNENLLNAKELLEFKVNFEWEEEIGVPGAILIRNNNDSEFYLKTVTLEDAPGRGRIYFVCNSWVYPSCRYKNDRIFFSNRAYLPGETPLPLRKYREDELAILRGDGRGELQEWDRVYDYAYYNDLGDPDKGPGYARPVLGGSAEYPYPRRGRTGRPAARSDPSTESRLPLIMGLKIYVPRDEKFSHLKITDFLGFALKSTAQILNAGRKSLFDGKADEEFDSFEDVLKLHEGGTKVPHKQLLKTIKEKIPFRLLRHLLPSDDEGLFKFPMPQVIKEDEDAWRTDEEFTREMLAGVNPVVIRRLEKFPPASKLNPALGINDLDYKEYKEYLKNNVDEESVNEAVKSNRLFILDHFDALMPYLRRINKTFTKTYATRTLLYLNKDGTLKPLAIELSLPHPEGSRFGVTSEVYTPAEQGIKGYIWQLAKAYVTVNDSGYHQLISHWLNTHAVMEPFVIATNRQLSVMHPIYKLLHPHFRDTMSINATARQLLISAGGLLEMTVFPSKYAMEFSSSVYKKWKFPDQALPTDLIKRGIAVKDESNAVHGLRLLIEDYPYAVDGLDIWSAIRTWVNDYCVFYYKSDDMVRKDPELQAWWKEVREKGHGDKKDEPWWPKMETHDELIETCTIIIWVASALHAAINFGQYPYAGYLPNRPTISRKLMPKVGTDEYRQLESKPDKFFLDTITSQLQTLIGISLIELLSRHSSEEIYLGQRDTPEWTFDKEILEAFERFRLKLVDIEKKIIERNNDKKLKNRMGPVKLPYTLLCPTSEPGLTGKGIPNSVSI